MATAGPTAVAAATPSKPKVAGGVIVAILAVGAFTVVVVAVLLTTYLPARVPVRDAASSAQARAVSTPVRYLDGSRASVAMCNAGPNCRTLSPVFECVRTGVDYAGCGARTSRAACVAEPVCEWADSRCRLRPALEAHRGAPATGCSTRSALKCDADPTCRWNATNRFCSHNFSSSACAAPCMWSSCESYDGSRTSCERAGCTYGDSGTCTFNAGTSGEPKTCATQGSRCKATDLTCKYTSCIKTGCQWSVQCSNGRCSNSDSKTCSTLADCCVKQSGGETDCGSCVDPGVCGMCEAGLCGSLETNVLAVQGSAGAVYDGEYEYEPSSSADLAYENASRGTSLKWEHASSRWEFSGSGSTSYHAPTLSQNVADWVSDAPGTKPMFTGDDPHIHSSLCPSHTREACATDTSCIWNPNAAMCVSNLRAIQNPWCTPCSSLGGACPLGVCRADGSRCENVPGVGKYTGVCPDLMTGCGDVTDCYKCSQDGLCPDNRTRCASNTDCQAAVCRATQGVSWDDETKKCENKTCWGECRVPAHYGPVTASRTCDDELAFAFGRRIGDMASDPNYAVKTSAGTWKWKSHDEFISACLEACSDCPPNLKAGCSRGCEFTTATGETCEEACRGYT